MKQRLGFAFAMVAILAFIGGYLLAERQAKSALADQSVTELTNDVAAIAYLDKGEVGKAKKTLYVAVDGQLGCLSGNQATVPGKENASVLSTVLNTLNKNWNVDRPFEGADDASLYQDPNWVAMRARNDVFRKNYAKGR
jgi:hypothetical protein